MLPGPDLKIKCPSCGRIYYRGSITSGNTFGAFYFSDGKRFAPHLPEFPYFVKCQQHECGVFFAVNNTVVCTSDEDHLGALWFLSIAEYIQAIETGLFDSGKKGSAKWNNDILSLRIELWRAFNHRTRETNFYKILMKKVERDIDIRNAKWDFERYRKFGQYSLVSNLLTPEITRNNMTVLVIEGMKYPEPYEKAIYDDNCREIISLIAEMSDNESCLIKAELYRNIGDYDMCKNLLKKISQPEYQSAILTINTACEIETTLTALLR